MGCRNSTMPSRVSLEQRNGLFSNGNGSIIAGGWDKMEIPLMASIEHPDKVFGPKKSFRPSIGELPHQES